VTSPEPPAVLVVALVLFLAIALWWLRSFRAGIAFGLPLARKPKVLSTVDRLALTANHSLHVVKVSKTLLLIGISPQGCHLLSDSVSLEDVEG